MAEERRIGLHRQLPHRHVGRAHPIVRCGVAVALSLSTISVTLGVAAIATLAGIAALNSPPAAASGATPQVQILPVSGLFYPEATSWGGPFPLNLCLSAATCPPEGWTQPSPPSGDSTYQPQIFPDIDFDPSATNAYSPNCGIGDQTNPFTDGTVVDGQCES